ncbi:MAG: hypothetical protein FWE98_06300 [Oscillospiraceae bacterium]|nr:hypothetical protein [Oscillospiraceae bacterium]
MKRLLIISLALALLLIAGCGVAPEAPTEPTIEITTVVTTTEAAVEKPLPLYHPDEIKLAPIDVLTNEYEYRPSKREVYYTIPGALINLCPRGTMDEVEKLTDKNRVNGEPTEMRMVTLIKLCNIPREAFEEVIRCRAELNVSWGWDMSDESNEVPNADIIYTFDNEIINAYYRRENPVVPDWLTNLQ